MRIGIVNQSKRLQDKNIELAEIAGAVTRQVIRDAAPAWGWLPTPVSMFRKKEKIPKDVFPIFVRDALSESDVLGLHTEGYGEVGVDVILDNGGTLHTGPNSVSAVLSHEVLETLGDITVNLWADMDDNRQTALELCDAVENDVYEVDGIAVSNFLLPAWFDGGLLKGKPPYDHMGLLKKPFSIRPDGYWIVRGYEPDSEKSEWGVKVQFGLDFPEWKKSQKLHKFSRTSTRALRVF